MENDIVKIHDYCLEYELEILSVVEALAERRITATKIRALIILKTLCHCLMKSLKVQKFIKHT